MPLDGMDRYQYLTAKFGGENNARSVYQSIEDEGEKNKIFFQIILEKKFSIFMLFK